MAINKRKERAPKEPFLDFSMKLLALLHRVISSFPCLSSAEQGKCVSNSFSFELRYQTGTRVFGRSGTVGNYLFIFRKTADLSVDLAGRDVHSSLDVLGLILLGRTSINEIGISRVKGCFSIS